jgi:NhaP-type Na+/H+ or K+/H+ antiporter
MGGARRQIFIVFAAFLMVQKFHYDVASITLLLLINAAINMALGPVIGVALGLSLLVPHDPEARNETVFAQRQPAAAE